MNNDTDSDESDEDIAWGGPAIDRATLGRAIEMVDACLDHIQHEDIKKWPGKGGAATLPPICSDDEEENDTQNCKRPREEEDSESNKKPKENEDPESDKKPAAKEDPHQNGPRRTEHFDAMACWNCYNDYTEFLVEEEHWDDGWLIHAEGEWKCR